MFKKHQEKLYLEENEKFYDLQRERTYRLYKLRYSEEYKNKSWSEKKYDLSMYLDEMKIAPEIYDTIIPYHTKQNFNSQHDR